MHISSSFLFIINLFQTILCQTSCDIDGHSASYTETIIDDQRNIISSGCPNHDNTCLGKPGVCTDQGISLGITQTVQFPKDVNIPAYPCINDVPDGVGSTCIGGDIGIMLNGVSLFSQTAGGAECEDAISAEFTTFNQCGGHSTGAGQFHYHLAPACLIYQLHDHGTINKNNQHSPQLGWSYDGFPIYGPHGINGEYIYKCSDTRAAQTDCLDSCNGHMQHTIDDFTYHYHITGPIGDLQGDIKMDPIYPIPDASMFPYTIGCFRGIPSDRWKPIFRNVQCAMNGTTNDYVPQSVDGVTIVYPEQVTVVKSPTTSTIASTTSSTLNPVDTVSKSGSTSVSVDIKSDNAESGNGNILEGNTSELLIYGAVGLVIICMIGVILCIWWIKCRKKKNVEYESAGKNTKLAIEMMDNMDNEQVNIVSVSRFSYGNTLKPTKKGHHVADNSSSVWA
eukprot:361111_1